MLQRGYLQPAVNRQPGYHRGPRRASFRTIERHCEEWEAFPNKTGHNMAIQEKVILRIAS